MQFGRPLEVECNETSKSTVQPVEFLKGTSLFGRTNCLNEVECKSFRAVSGYGDVGI